MKKILMLMLLSITQALSVENGFPLKCTFSFPGQNKLVTTIINLDQDSFHSSTRGLIFEALFYTSNGKFQESLLCFPIEGELLFNLQCQDEEESKILTLSVGQNYAEAFFNGTRLESVECY